MTLTKLNFWLAVGHAVQTGGRVRRKDRHWHLIYANTVLVCVSKQGRRTAYWPAPEEMKATDWEIVPDLLL